MTQKFPSDRGTKKKFEVMRKVTQAKGADLATKLRSDYQSFSRKALSELENAVKSKRPKFVIKINKMASLPNTRASFAKPTNSNFYSLGIGGALS